MCAHTHKNQCSPFLRNSKYFLFRPISFSAYYGLNLITWLNYWSISWITDILQHRTLQKDIPSTPGQSKSSSDSLIAFWIQLWVQGQRENKEYCNSCPTAVLVEVWSSWSLPALHTALPPLFCPQISNPTFSNQPKPRGYGKMFPDYWQFCGFEAITLGRRGEGRLQTPIVSKSLF